MAAKQYVKEGRGLGAQSAHDRRDGQAQVEEGVGNRYCAGEAAAHERHRYALLPLSPGYDNH
jgi:hypothetical protein